MFATFFLLKQKQSIQKGTHNTNTKQSKRLQERSSRSSSSKALPPFLQCPTTGEKVWIATATLPDIKQAARLGKQPWHPSRKYLLQVNGE